MIYHETLGQRLIGSGFIFQQENDRRHSAGAVRAFPDRKLLSVMDWLPLSLDLNFIEAVWDHGIGKQSKRQPSSKGRECPSIRLGESTRNLALSCQS